MRRNLLALAGLGLIPLGSTLASQNGTLLPSEDSFYSSPSNISLYSPGEIIASRSISADLNGILGISASNISLAGAYQFLYRTSDSFRNPAAAVATMLVPHNAKTDKLLSYQAVYDSANINCSPSYAIRAGANTTAVLDIVFVRCILPDRRCNMAFPLTPGVDRSLTEQGLVCRLVRLRRPQRSLRVWAASWLRDSRFRPRRPVQRVQGTHRPRC